MNFEIINDRYQLIVDNKATFKDFENIYNFLMEKMELRDVEDINDYDSQYQIFEYRNQQIVLFYSNYLGVSIYIRDKTMSTDAQLEILNEFLEILRLSRFGDSVSN